MARISKTTLAVASLALVALTSCDKFRGFPSEKPPVHLVLDMDFQPKVRAQSEHEFEGWTDHRGARRPVSDSFGNTLVVARGSLPNAALANRDGNNAYVTTNPLQSDHKFMVRGREMSMIDRGRERFEIFCSMCHGPSGQGGNGKLGHGIVGKRWDVAIPSFHFSTKAGADNRVPDMPDGEYFETITTGKGTTMPAYGARISVADRWAIVHYVRALQSLSK
ncbi:MAG: mono/diheme cytochrome c family protein [Planctomycetota bacterium]|jgi:mono/diheme cytochrome c family protein